MIHFFLVFLAFISLNASVFANESMRQTDTNQQISQVLSSLEDCYKQEYGPATRVFTTSQEKDNKIIIHTKNKHYTLEQNLEETRKVAKAPYHSQFDQDKYVNEHFFHNKQNGVFVDIGAHNGVSFSNSCFFEKVLGWTGICVEPLPNVFSALKKNRNCICINGCVSDFDGQATFIKVNKFDMLSGLEEKMDPRHWERFHIKPNEIQKIKVQCFKPNTLFSQHGITHIDFLSVDTEGGELDIIKAIDFSEISIDIITVEVNYKNDRQIYNYLTSNGYKFVAQLGVDELYKKIEEQ